MIVLAYTSGGLIAILIGLRIIFAVLAIVEMGKE